MRGGGGGGDGGGMFGFCFYLLYFLKIYSAFA